MKLHHVIASAGFFAFAIFSSEVTLASNTVKTYLPFSYPVDPVKIVTIADMDLSYALGGTLVEWSKDKQISAGIASKWETTSGKVLRFHIRSGLKWSDGTPLKSNEIKTSLEAAFKRFPDDLRAVISIVEEIRAPSDQLLDIHLKVDVANSNLLGKFTEPQYAVFSIKHGTSEVNVKKTAGAFFVESETSGELSLIRNPNWFKFKDGTPRAVSIRKLTSSMDTSNLLLNDAWANVIETSSMISEEVLNKYRSQGYAVWTRPLDKMLYFQLGKRIQSEVGTGLLRHLGSALDKAILGRGLPGLKPANQTFPEGFQLHDPKMACAEGGHSLPSDFHKKILRIMISPARVGPQLKVNLIEAMTKIMGTAPEIIEIDLAQLAKSKSRTDYDLYFGTMGLADPDPEGAMSYYFEGDQPIIPEIAKGFVSRLDAARKLGSLEKLTAFRAILRDAHCGGHFLPVFHLSTVGIGKPEIDFSSLSETDESVTLSKIRFKEGKH